MKRATLLQLYVEQLDRLYDMEERSFAVLPRMSGKATSKRLKHALEIDLHETANQRKRLEGLFDELHKTPGSCPKSVHAELVAEALSLSHVDGTAEIHDAAIVAAAQRLKYYEMGAYRIGKIYAESLHEENAAVQLQESAEEEKRTVESLTRFLVEELFA